MPYQAPEPMQAPILVGRPRRTRNLQGKSLLLCSVELATRITVLQHLELAKGIEPLWSDLQSLALPLGQANIQWWVV